MTASLPEPRAVILDFDGVILESVEIKGRAFRALFSAHPEHQDAIERFHYDHAGMSRFDKLRWIHRELLRVPLFDDDLARLDRAFGAMIADAIRVCPPVRGALAFLEHHSARRPLFIASGTPEPELREILVDRGLSKFFAGVYGSPARKTELLQRVAREVAASPADLLFIGDGDDDDAAAGEAGVPFVGRRTPQRRSTFSARALGDVGDLAELDARWLEILGKRAS